MTSSETIEQVNKRLARQITAVSVLFVMLAAAIGSTSSMVERRMPLAVYAALALLYFLVLVGLLLQARTARRLVRDYIAALSEAERESKLMEQLVRLLADGSNTPYWIWHPAKGQFELHGPWAQHAGIDGQVLSHGEFFDSVVSRASVEQVFREAQDQLLPVSRIVARDLGDGETLTTVATFIPVRRANNELLVMIGTSVDIDSQLKSQKDLDAAVNESRATRAFVTALCATLGEHAGAAAAAVERLRASSVSNAAADLAMVAAGTREVRQLISEASELFQAQAPRSEHIGEVPVAAVFDIAVSEAMRNAPPFQIDVAPALPADRPVEGDPAAVQRIFELLIQNAAAMGGLDGGLSAKVRARYIAGPTCKVEIVVVGPKVSLLELSYLGEPFYKGSGRDRVDPTGMRLAIARALANSTGAKLTLSNSIHEDEGLVATVEFQLADHD